MNTETTHGHSLNPYDNENVIARTLARARLEQLDRRRSGAGVLRQSRAVTAARIVIEAT